MFGIGLFELLIFVGVILLIAFVISAVVFRK
jgi:hypothetical protein